MAAVYPQIPDVDVRYSNLSYTLQLPKSAVNYEIETVPGATLATALALPRAVAGLVKRVAGAADTSTQPFKVLDGVSGVLRPGTVTLLLSPPGHGKTSFLRALAGRLPHEKLAGSLEYSGVPADRLLASGVHLRLLANYSDQLDIHLPFQTVREVASFSYENGTVDPSLLREADPSGELEREAANRVERVLKLLSLQNCADVSASLRQRFEKRAGALCLASVAALTVACPLSHLHVSPLPAADAGGQRSAARHLGG